MGRCLASSLLYTSQWFAPGKGGSGNETLPPEISGGITGGNDSRKRHEKRLIFKIGTIHIHRLNKRFSLIWFLHSFCFCPAQADKSGDFSPFHSIIYVHPPPTLCFTLCFCLVYWSTLKIANDLPIFASYYAFVIVSLTWLSYFLSHDYLSY